MRADGKRDSRRDGGFTLVELLAAIVILGIVAALVFVAVGRYQRVLYQREMDETAKEIYVAAQNHLTLADSLGTFSGRTAKGHPDTVHEDGPDGEDVYYFVVGAAGSDAGDLDNRRSILNAMLPYGSIDETVRADGSYIVRYRYSESSSAVLDVLYADPDGRYPLTFSNADFEELFEGDAYTSAPGAEARRADYRDAIIGYYGGEDASLESGELRAPKVRVTNAEELTATVANASDFSGKATVELYIAGKSSGALYGPCALNAAGNTFVIDSVTVEGSHFANLESVNDNSFIPGEDITVQAFALSTNSLRMTKSAKRSTNSLFASISGMSTGDLVAGVLNAGGSGFGAGAGGAPSLQAQAVPSTRYARIANMRHLENLDANISGYDSSCTAKLGNRAPAVYEQVADLSWADFRKKVVGLAARADGPMPGDTEESLAVRVYDMRGYATAPGSYAPVTPDARLNVAYEGNSHRVSDVTVSAGDMAGMFGQLENADVSNLELVNFDLDAARDVGGLAGKAINARVSGVLVRNAVAGGDDAALELSSSGGSVGGLVGALEGTSEVSGCAAAVYVRTGGNDAGGLIGYMSGTASLSDSYAGGHTSGGAYLVTTDSGVAGRVNVVSAGRSAGGLVGISFADATIQSCYSTCSVQGGSNVGGLVGWMYAGGAMANCYATGLVQAGADGASLGGFAGAMGGMRRVEGNRYYDMVNYGRNIGPVGSGSSAGITAFDESTAAYNGFATGSSPAYPYDAALAGAYPFRTVAELGGSSAADAAGMTAHLNAHIGDWPTPETLVVNMPG